MRWTLRKKKKAMDAALQDTADAFQDATAERADDSASVRSFRRKARQAYENVKEMTEEAKDNAHMLANAKAQTHYHARWMEICGVSSYEDIDWSEPHVNMEAKMCDMVNLTCIKSRDPEVRRKWYDQLTDEQMEIWFNEVDEHHYRYCFLEPQAGKYRRLKDAPFDWRAAVPRPRRRVMIYLVADGGLRSY